MVRKSSHFDGRRYYNPSAPHRSFLDFLCWISTRRPIPWPKIPTKQQKILCLRAKEDECFITFITHSTVLIQIKGWNILTDPIWSERASPFSWIGPKRHREVGIRFEDLPPIDSVLISHNHYDHMDLPTLRRLASEHQSTFFVSKGNQKYLESKGITRVQELDWWDKVNFFPSHSLYFVPAQHFSARGIFDRDRTLWGGYVIKNSKRMIYFAGDTGFGPHFEEIHQCLGAPTLSLLPIGAFKPRWFMKTVHLSPKEAVKAHLILNSKQSLAIHFGTFQLSDEEIEAPIKELQQALRDYALPLESFWILEPGESREIN